MRALHDACGKLVAQHLARPAVRGARHIVGHFKLAPVGDRPMAAALPAARWI